MSEFANIVAGIDPCKTPVEGIIGSGTYNGKPYYFFQCNCSDDAIAARAASEDAYEDPEEVERVLQHEADVDAYLEACEAGLEDETFATYLEDLVQCPPVALGSEDD